MAKKLSSVTEPKRKGQGIRNRSEGVACRTHPDTPRSVLHTSTWKKLRSVRTGHPHCPRGLYRTQPNNKNRSKYVNSDLLDFRAAAFLTVPCCHFERMKTNCYT